MQRAFILVNADPGKLWEIENKSTKVRGVKMAYAVTGAFDVIIYAEVANMDELSNLIHRIQLIEGINSTQTTIAIPHRVNHSSSR